jgi:3-hydroxyisobutyrate dehydrogenase
MQTVAILGLGLMGTGMAENLLKAGFALTVYNRTRAKAEALRERGAQVGETPRVAVSDAQVVISMVGDDAASRAVWLGDDGALAGARPDAVLVECSTLSLEWTRELAEAAAQRGLTLLDAPVGGSKDAAAAGELRLLVGGDAEGLERARPTLEAISKTIDLFGRQGTMLPF